MSVPDVSVERMVLKRSLMVDLLRRLVNKTVLYPFARLLKDSVPSCVRYLTREWRRMDRRRRTALEALGVNEEVNPAPIGVFVPFAQIRSS
jgi:hypothetical protein